MITDYRVTDDGQLIIEWDPVNFEPNINNFHVHIFFDVYEPEQVGANAAQFGVEQGNWQISDERRFDTTGTNVDITSAPAGAERLCIVVADSGHGVVSPEHAQCVPLP